MKDIYSFFAFLANCATVIGIGWAIYGTRIALKTYKSNNSIRKWELIKEIFDNFIKDGLYEFYERIKTGEQIDLESKDDEQLMNKALTIFDALNYFQTQGLLDEKAWEYFACEILNYALNNSVWKYIKRTEKQYKDIGFDEYIIPFSGFPDLYDNLPNKFKVMWPSELEKRFKMLSPEEQKLYYNKVEDIEGKELKHTAAIRLFAKDKGGTTPAEKLMKTEH